MTHLLDTSALLTHYLAEPGAERVQALLEDDAVVAGASILSLYEFELLQMHVIAGRVPSRGARLASPSDGKLQPLNVDARRVV